MTNTIKLIITDAPPPSGTEDRLGGKTHGDIRRAVARATLDVSADEFATQLEAVISVVQTIAGRLKTQVAEYSADEITIGLAVSGEGSIGVATAGVEASIQVSLKRRT